MEVVLYIDLFGNCILQGSRAGRCECETGGLPVPEEKRRLFKLSSGGFIFSDTSITIWHQDCIEMEQAYEDVVTDQYVKEPVIVT